MVVIENKVDAGEQAYQCERLYWSFLDAPVETRWVLLSPTGRSPASTTTAAARSAWRTLSYAQVRHALGQAIDEAGDQPSDPGREAARQYLAALGWARQ